ncbi:MAG: hypothetical protein FWB88_05450 [Defluviitaleaceae bacterium]|nr:hypothetical protein [Defluviitaleaceae bacterium]MCL2240668.1 hypothetical protein [Defluviitaleaceae bacterium]
MMPQQQSNPVLFVLIGAAAELAPELNRLLEGYRLEAADCVIVPDPGDSAHLRSEINRIQQDFLQHRYTTGGLIRVGYILQDAAQLKTLRNHVENILSPLYPSGLITDIYWLADETSTLDACSSSRKNSIKVLSKGLPDTQIYLLSNLNSESRHTPWAEVIQTITLLALFKDGEPGEYAAPPDASRYNEFLFLQNAGNGKPFLTAGSVRLQIPRKALRALLMTALLQPLPLTAPSMPPLDMPRISPWVPEEEYIYGLALPREALRVVTDGMTRGTILNRLFGTRLDAVADINPPQCDKIDDAILVESLDDYMLFDALDITKHDGHWPAHLRGILLNNEATKAAAEKSLEQWLDAAQELSKLKTDKRKLSTFYTVANYPYTLAMEYLKRIASIRAYALYSQLIHEMLERVAEIHARLGARHDAVEAEREAYGRDAQALTVTGSPLASTEDYFLGLFAQHARANAEILRQLTLRFKEEIPIDALEAYIDAHILQDPIFSRSFTEMLAHVADDKSLTEWAVNSRHLHIRLRSGSSALYNETNLHMSADWAAQVKYGYEAQGLGRANLFTDSATNRVSVLYHAGAFGPGDLYYADLYK